MQPFFEDLIEGENANEDSEQDYDQNEGL